MTPPSPELIAQVNALGTVAAAAGLPVIVTTVSGVTLLNGMPVWELGAAEGSQYDAISSFTQPQSVAINLSSITWGDIGENDPADVAELVNIAIHESAHQAFAIALIQGCASDVLLWSMVVLCHKQHSGNACNENYAYSRTVRELCESLEDLPPGGLRDAIEVELAEQIDACVKFEAACVAANAKCGPPSMIMPPDHIPCGGCEACSECE